MTQSFTLAVDIDVLLSSASATSEGCGWFGPEPSFKYTVGSESATIASAAEQLTNSSSGSAAQPAAGLSDGLPLTRYAWLRPGVRRFLLAIQPHFRTVLVVRRRCSVRRCCCSSAALSESGQVSACSVGRISADLHQGAGGCSAALLAAALPNIDPDGQFFGNRVVLVQDRPRPRTAQPRLTMTAPATLGGPAPSVNCGAASAAPARRPVAGAARGAEAAVTFPAQARDLSALASALGERPSRVIVVTVANRSIFGVDLCDQVVECQPYRKEYGKYDDVLDCLASVVSELLVEASVPQGLRRLGLLHGKLEPSPMMQTLHAQMALRHAQHGRPPQQQPQPQALAQALTAPPPPQQQQQGSQASLAQQVCKSLASKLDAAAAWENQRQQQLQQQKQAASRKSSARTAKSGRRPGSGKSDPGDSGGGGGERSTKGRGNRPLPPLVTTASGISISGSAAASPLPPIPELPLLEVGADWPDSSDEADAEAGARCTPPLPPQGPASGCGSAPTSGSCVMASGPHGAQGRSFSSPTELCTCPDMGRGSGNMSAPSCSSDGSRNSNGSCGCGGGTSSAATLGPSTPSTGQPMTSCGRRRAWDADPGALGGGIGSLVATLDSSATAALLQRLKPAGPIGATGAGDAPPARVGFVQSHANRDLGWRPGSFPAAAKPPVTRHISDCASQSASPNGAAAAAAGSAADAVPASPLTAAANAVAAATSRLLSRMLGGRGKRRCRPSDAGEDGGPVSGAAAGLAAAGVVTPRRSAVSATHASRAWSDTGEGICVGAGALHHARVASASAASAGLLAAALTTSGRGGKLGSAAGGAGTPSNLPAAAAGPSFSGRSAPSQLVSASLPVAAGVGVDPGAEALGPAPACPSASLAVRGTSVASGVLRFPSGSESPSFPCSSQTGLLQVPSRPAGRARSAAQSADGRGSEAGAVAAAVDGMAAASTVAVAATAAAAVRRHSDASGTLGALFWSHPEIQPAGKSHAGLWAKGPGRDGEQQGKEATLMGSHVGPVRCDPRVAVLGGAARVVASDAGDEAVLEGRGSTGRCAAVAVGPRRDSLSGASGATVSGSPTNAAMLCAAAVAR